MKINPTIVVKNLETGTLNQLKGQKTILLSITPYLIGSLVLRGLSEAVVKYPAEQVIPFASTALNYSIYPVIILAAWKMWKALEKNHGTVEGRKIEYIQIPKEEFNKLQEELERLKKTENEVLANKA